MPISSPGSYDNTGAQYNISNIITNGQFDEEKYKAYSPLFLPATFAIAYGVQFAAITAVVVHTFREFRVLSLTSHILNVWLVQYGTGMTLPASFAVL